RRLEPIARDEPGLRRFQVDLTWSYLGLGAVSEPSHSAEAEALARKAVAIGEQLTRQFPRMERYSQLLAQARRQVAECSLRNGDGSEAERLLLAALAPSEKLARKQPEFPSYQAALADVHNSLGVVYRHRSRFEDAARAHRQALALAEALAEKYPQE